MSPPRGVGRAGRLASLAVAALVLGCGEPSDAPPPAESDSALDLPEDSTQVAGAFDFAALTDRLPADGPRRPSDFAHTAHVTVACVTCHASPPGHGPHGDMECAACHASSPGAAPATPAECDACHHGPEQRAGCATCHDDGPADGLAVTQPMRLAGRRTARPLLFLHAPHADRACGTCHQQGGGRGDPGCAECHDDHHRPTASCEACHQPPAAGVHDLAAHEGCGGSGCHAPPAAELLPGGRNVCLACHTEETEHEPGGECLACHLAGPDPGAEHP